MPDPYILTLMADTTQSLTLFVSWFLLFYILAISKVISGWVPTYDSAHSWQLYSASPPGCQHYDNPLGHIILTLSEPVLAVS